MFSSQQIEAAHSIVAAYTAIAAIYYSLLVSLTQAGKTGTFHKIIQQMFAEGNIQRAYILCGSNEKELRTQAIKDSIDYNKDLYESGKLEVLFRQDFKQGRKFRKINTHNTLLIIEESHLDQTVGQELHQFLLYNGITLDGNPANLAKNNTYILSVSATPYSELAAHTHKETPFQKHIVHLKPGDGYYGLAEYDRDNLIRPTYTIKENREIFADLIGERGNKWCLVRLPASGNGPAQESAIKSICAERGYKLLYYTSSSTEVAMTRREQKAFLNKIPCLKDAPEVPTVVIIRGRLRAGKVVPKTHINFVWEGAEDSKTDSIVQGLLGRMCGYKFGEIKPFIYVPLSFLERDPSKVCPHSEMDRALDIKNTLPRFATNMNKTHVANKSHTGKTQCVPLRITMDPSYDTWLLEIAEGMLTISELRERAKQVITEKRMEIETLVRSSQYYSPAQKDEIIGFLGKAKPHIRGKGDLRETYYKQYIEAYRSGTTASENISDNHDLTFIFWKKAYAGIEHANHRHIYIVFYTKAGGGDEGLSTVNLKSRIPQTNGKSVFSLNTGEAPRDYVAGGINLVPTELVQTPGEMKATLHEYLAMWAEAVRIDVMPRIQAEKDRFVLRRKAFHYKSPKDNDLQRICEELGTEFNVKMHVKYCRSGSDTFNVKEISWE